MSVTPMSAIPLRDSWTMLRRNLLQMVRYRSLTLMLIGQPLIFLLLFVYVFGATMGVTTRWGCCPNPNSTNRVTAATTPKRTSS